MQKLYVLKFTKHIHVLIRDVYARTLAQSDTLAYFDDLHDINRWIYLSHLEGFGSFGHVLYIT
jgi:hypothetical protein